MCEVILNESLVEKSLNTHHRVYCKNQIFVSSIEKQHIMLFCVSELFDIF